MQTSQTPPTGSPHSYHGSFYQAHHFDIHNSTFIDTTGNVRKLEELKIDLKNTIIRRATYEELSRNRRKQFDNIEVPPDIEGWIKNPDYSFNHRFLQTSNKDILSLSGIPIVRYFRNKPTPGIKLVAHILFYDIPITDDAFIISTRPNVSHRWITTLAYQLMLHLPEITIPMLEALHLDPTIPHYNSEVQLQKLIINPLQSIVKQGLLSSDDTILLILLDCIDCSTDAPLMAADIAYLIEELQSINSLRLKLLVTGLPDKQVLCTFRNLPILVSELRWPKRISRYDDRQKIPLLLSIRDRWTRLSVLQKKYFGELLFATGALILGALLSVWNDTAIPLYIATLIIVMLAFVECLVSVIFLMIYLELKYRRPWDVHGRKEVVKRIMLGTRWSNQSHE